MTHIGIDLGTTYSCVMHSESEGIESVVPSPAGGNLTPSVVYFEDDGMALVGDDAKRLGKADPDNAAVGIKRHMGRDHMLEFRGVTYSPEAISGILLRRLAEDAAQHFGVPIERLQSVITVPAYFGVAEKEATHAAARIAGLTCLELLAEPVAAAYGYGIDLEVEDTSLVFDLGGGTFDVAAVGPVQGRPRIWAVDGEMQLGGIEWDRRLAELMWDRLASQGVDVDEELGDGLGAVVDARAETLKRSLSVHDAVIERFRLHSETYPVRVTRAEFDEASRDLVRQCIDTAQRVGATAAALGAPRLARILLVGGSTRMPQIPDALEQNLGVPCLRLNPDLAVAKGAARLAARLVQGAADDRRTGVGPARITPVLPKGIGIKIHSSMLPARPEPYVRAMVPANTPLPVAEQRIEVATILNDQESARIEIFEQAGAVPSENLSHNRIIFDGEVVGLPPGPAGTLLVLKVSLDVAGRLTVRATHGPTGAELEVPAFIHGVVDESELQEQRGNIARLMVV